jgi:cob(I)alamin adenosyltransferase
MVVLNRIYTRGGDDGTTALGTGERRKKCDLRIEAYGVTAAALKYVNRLSDFLFVAARSMNQKGATDVLWVPGQNC